MLPRIALFVLCLLLAACTKSEPAKPKVKPSYDMSNSFVDDATTNFQTTADAMLLQFVDQTGKTIALKDLRGKKHVALFIMRGMTKEPGGLCPTCNGQTSRLVANHAEFTKRNVEVLVVFPGQKADVAQFVEKVQTAATKSVPFPVLLDEDFKVVDKLGIRDDMAKPSTFLIDKEGQVRFAYVGASTSDRPSLAALYKQIDGLAKKTP